MHKGLSTSKELTTCFSLDFSSCSRPIEETKGLFTGFGRFEIAVRRVQVARADRVDVSMIVSVDDPHFTDLLA